MATIEARPPNEALVPQPTNMIELLSLALQNNAAIDVIERLAALQEKQLARQAESAFNAAMTSAQGEVSRIAPNKTNSDTNSRWATYDKMDAEIRPVYLRHGFSLSFTTAECPKPETERIVCYVSHKDGHTRIYQKDIPADGKGAKGGGVMTRVQASGAASSYGMRYLLRMIFNIAIGEEDKDGSDGVNKSWLDERIEWLANAKDVPELQRMFATYANEALEARDAEAISTLKTARDKRKKELS